MKPLSLMKSSTKGAILHQGNFIISIENLSDYSRPVIVKRPSKWMTSKRIPGSLDREYDMSRSLDSIKGVRKVLGKQQIEDQQVLILEYIEGETLQDHISRHKLDIRSKLEIAIDLARLLGEIHQLNIIHLDINSSNILIRKKRREIHFIDLGSASYIDRNGKLKVQPDQPLENLSYISPEQTGRLNRSLDERSDLYSLGVVLYELMTGQLPFDSKDPMEVVHCHIARRPESPTEVTSEIPQILSAIILKLLSKNAEDRYQSAAGIQADLDKCLRNLSPDNMIEGFPLGEVDYSNRLRFTQKLYGRDSELKELESAFESVCRGNSSIVFIAGYPGIGKTAMIEEMKQPVSEKNGYYIQGKFDQLITTPYAGISQALSQFVSEILTQTETQLAAWRSKILETVGPNSRVLTDVVPNLELVVGPQPTVPDLSGQEAQNRLHYVFQRFFLAVARMEHPIFFFLDDLQWIDPASLGLLKALFYSPDLPQLLLVGAYRTNEVHENHPLMALIADLEKKGANMKRMTLQKLAEADVDELISNALWSDPREVQEIARLVYSQTDGNPLFTRQVLRSMEDQGLIALDTAKGHWSWDMNVLRDQDPAASIVELLVDGLKKLSIDIQETLKIAACIGNEFDIATLRLVIKRENETILDHVNAAVAAGLIWKRDDLCYFVHDSVQEATYALHPIEERDRTHLMIGRLLMEGHRGGNHEQDLYKIVDQLNRGLHLVEDEQERMQLARLNLQVAGAARNASAFETGLNYARAGIELLGEDAWERHYRLTLQLHEQAALLAYSVGDIPAMEQHSKQVLQFGRDPHDLGQIQRLHIEFLLSSKRFDEAIDFGLKALRILGQEFLPEPDWAFTTAKLSEFLEHLEQRPPDYVSIPRLYDQDPELLSVSDILFSLGSAAYIYRPAMAPLMYMRSLELSLERQLLSDHTPAMIIAVGVFANALLEKVEMAHAYGEIAMELASRAAFHIDLNTVLHIQALHIHFWRKPLRETLGLFDRAVQSAHDFGSNEYASYARHGWSKHAVYASIELAQVEESSLKRRTFLDAIQNVTVGRWINIYVTAVQALRGNSSAQGSTWRGSPFDDDKDIPDLQRVGDQNGLLYAYCAKAWIATLFGDHSGVKEFSDLSHSFIMASPTGVEKAILTFVCGLRRARELRVTPENTESEQALQEQLGLLERFAGLAPMNFSHKLSLVQAEAHRARGEVVQAMQSYEKASEDARDNNYLNEAGLAHALAAEFFQDLGLHQAALYNLEQAAKSWRSWGAHALVENLSQRFADLPGSSDLSWESSSDSDAHVPPITQPISSIQLDLDSITSASHMLSAETDLNHLLIKMIKIVMANSGAETAVLLMKLDNDWFVQARGNVSSQDHEVLLNLPLESVSTNGTESVPERVHQYCRRSMEVLIVGDARSDDRFAEDKTVQARSIRSMACIPVMAKGECRSMLYLENCHVADAFTEERIALLKHLSSQFGISVENALLYANLNKKIEEIEESESRFRSVVENANETIIVTQDEVVKFCNEQIRDLTGYSPAEISSKSFDELIHPEDLDQVWSEYHSRISGKQSTNSYSIRIITKNGQEKHAFVNAALVNWDGRPASLAMLADITEQKQAEEALLKSEKRFRSLMEQSPLAIELVEPNGQISQVNKAWRKLWGLKSEEVARVVSKYNIRTDPQFEDKGVAHLVEKAFSGQNIVLPPFKYDANRTIDDFDIEGIKGLKQPWIQCHLYSVKNENEEIVHVVNTYLDISDLKYAEHESQKKMEMLALVGRASRMGQLTGSIAHELNQPLTGILSNAQAAELMMKKNLWEKEGLRDIMGDIISDTKRAGEVIRNLKELYREQKIEFLPIDINSVVDETLRLLHSEIILQQVALTKDLESSLPPVNGNRVQLQQVLVNLIMNGLHAMSGKENENRQLHIKSAFNKNKINVWVEDNGTGIEPEKIDRIFEPLVTLEPGGTGMGLAISSSIIESHGGKMSAENRNGGGARIGFFIPSLTRKKQK